MPRSSALFTECPTRRTFKCAGLNRPHIQRWQLRCKRVSRSGAKSTGGHGLWHVPERGSATLRRGGSSGGPANHSTPGLRRQLTFDYLTAAPIYLWHSPIPAVLPEMPQSGIISPAYLRLGLLPLRTNVIHCAGAPALLCSTPSGTI